MPFSIDSYQQRKRHVQHMLAAAAASFAVCLFNSLKENEKIFLWAIVDLFLIFSCACAAHRLSVTENLMKLTTTDLLALLLLLLFNFTFYYLAASKVKRSVGQTKEH